MKLKAASGIMLTLLVIGISTLAFNIQPVKAEPVTITVIGPWAGVEMDAFLQVLQAFENQTGINVNYNTLTSWDLASILPAQFANGTTPGDVILMWPWWIAEWSQEGHILEVTDLIDECDFLNGTFDPVKVSDKIYGGAWTGKVKPGFWYRKSFFAVNGLTEPTTWAEFLTLLDDIAALPGVVNPILSGDGVGWPLSDVTEHFIATYGGPQLHRDLTNGTVAWNSTQVRNIFATYLVPLLAGDFSDPKTWDTYIENWWNGSEYGLYFMGSWITGMVDDPTDLGVFTLPGAEGVVFSADYFFLPAYTEHPKEAKELFQFLASAEAQSIQVAQGGHIATNLGVPLDAYPAVDRMVANLTVGKEVLLDLDDAIGGEFQTTFWDQLKLLWVDPAALDDVLAAIQAVAPCVKYEHELVVRLDAPNFLEPGDSSLLNATVYNRGLSNETDVELFLLIDGTEVGHVTIPELVNGASYTIDYLWTPTVEATYNVTAYAPPVPGENITANNWRTELVGVFEIVKAVVLDSWGTDYGYNAFWDYLNTNWATYGSIPIVIDYTSLNKEDITLADIEATQADVLIISDAWDYWYGWEFTDSEIEAIKTYVLGGHGIIATSGTFNTMDGMAPNNRKLADLFGMDSDIEYRWAIETSGTFDLLTPRHDELWRNIPDPYLSDFTFTIYPYPSSDWTIQGVTNGWIEALSTDHYGAVITNEVYRAVYFTCMIEHHGQHNENNRQLFYNAIVWAQSPPYEHDLAVSIEVPDFLEPGDSSLLNATVYNLGLSNETNVELQLLINGSVVDSVVIPELVSRSSYTLSYLWTPILEEIYNVTVYALPVPDENATTNNVYSAFVTVRFAPRILAYMQYTDYWQEYMNSLAAIDSTFGSAYILTELWDYTQLDSMLPGNDVLFIPEQEYSYLSMMETIGEAWSETLSNFLEEGGVIILCDHTWGDGGTYGILTGAGLMSISSVHSITGQTVYLVDPTDPLANGVSSSFTAPNGALSFVTDETNVVFDDGTHPVVIHKEAGNGHIALIGFDYYASNQDADQILGNAVGLALYMTISVSPSAGSPGTEVTVTGTKAAADGVVEIYWDDTFIGDAIADGVGDFTYLLTVPPDATAGLHEIRAVDVATGETSSRTFRVIFITIDPISGPIGTKVTVNGAGFSAYTQVPITFDDMQIGYAITDEIGNFTFVFNIPLSEAGLHAIKAWHDFIFVETSFTVIDVTPLEIQMDVGSIFFKGETAEFYLQTCFKGMPVDATSINVTLCMPDGTVEALVAQKIATGLYKTECPIKGKGSMVGTYMLVIEASYTTSTVDCTGTCIKTFLVKEPYTTLEKEAPKAALMVGSIGTILALVITWRKRKQFKE